MNTYNFSIVVGGVSILNDDDMEAASDMLFEAGCDDGLVLTCNTTLYIDFDREAENYEDAVSSAIKDIESIDSFKCLSVDAGDTVNLSDAAELSGINKMTLSRYSKGERGAIDFPHPIERVDSSRPLWSWGEIAEWLESKGLIDHEVVNIAKITHRINTALSIRNANDILEINKYLHQLNNKMALAI